MFYFLMAPLLMYNWALILAAVVPAVFLMVQVFKSDRLEPESPAMLWSVVTGGILSALLALVEEYIGQMILGSLVEPDTVLYNVLLYFVLVAGAEESSKYIFLKKRTWLSHEFNCQYDGVVYAVFTSLGFALWENISYVMHYGFSTAIVRAITAIPGHACFGVFMGVFYGLSRGYAFIGKKELSSLFRVLAVIIPMLIHGSYDYIASMQSENASLYFIGFIAVLFLISFYLVHKMSVNDHYFKMDRYHWDFEILN